jgi:hypothetical protein
MELILPVIVVLGILMFGGPRTDADLPDLGKASTIGVTHRPFDGECGGDDGRRRHRDLTVPYPGPTNAQGSGASCE